MAEENLRDYEEYHETRQELLQSEDEVVCSVTEKPCRHLVKRRGEREHFEPQWVWECDFDTEEDCPYKEDADG